MRRLALISIGFSASAALLAGCDRNPLEPPLRPDPARGGNSAPAYTSVDLGKLLAGSSSRANAVNDAGDVAGNTCCTPGQAAFAIVGGAVITLPGGGQDALAISNGNPRYVAGWGGAPSQPALWTIDAGQASQPTTPALGSATYGAARGVNDAGGAVGNAGAEAAIWNADGSLALTFLPAGFVRGEGRDINNAGHAVFVFFAPGSSWSGTRGYFRLATGELVELPPLEGDVTSYANAISEVANGRAYIAGTSRSTPENYRSVRWTIDVTTGAITDRQVRSENSHALGVSNSGAVGGFVEPPANTLKFKAYLWRGAEILFLGAPKSGKDPHAWAISPSGEYLAGEAFFGTARHAVRWTILAP